jgi:hypothetical protein
MKRKSFKLVILMTLILVVSCDEPETVVTNFVHPDGSVTRKIEMRNIKKDFKTSDFQVPFDSTWTVRDSIEIGVKGDTVWIKRAEKLFKNVEEINSAYRLDTGANKVASRHAGFGKKFKWFNTEYRFSETIDKKMTFGYPVRDFLNEEELKYFYSPESLKSEKDHGPDSLRYRAMSDTINHKTDKWAVKNIVSEWIGEFARITGGKGGKETSMESLRAREDLMYKVVEKYETKFDSLWAKGVILHEFLGIPDAAKYKAEADSALSIAEKNFLIDFKKYSVRIVMPGNLTGTNGFIDDKKTLLWPVNSDYFMTETYEMWAESKVPNTWAWIVSGLFLVFVFTGVIMRIIKKG